MKRTRVEGFRILLACALTTLCCAGGVAATTDHEAARRALRPRAPAPADSTVLVAKLVEGLADEEYATREIAAAKLRRLLEGPKCETVAAQLRRNLATATDPEAKRRLEELVKSTELPAPGDFMVAVQGALARTPIGSESTLLAARLRQGLEKLKGDAVPMEALLALVKECGLKDDPANRSVVAPPGVFAGTFTAASGRKYWVEVQRDHILKVAVVTPDERLSLSLRDVLGTAAHACHIGSEESPRILMKVSQAATEELTGPIYIDRVWTSEGLPIPSFAQGEITRSIVRSDPARTPEKKEKLEKYLKDVLSELRMRTEP